MVQKGPQIQVKRDGPHLDEYGNAVLSVRLDLETYRLIGEASKQTFGKRDLSAYIRMASRTAAMEKIGAKRYRELLDEWGIVKRPEDLEE